MYIENYTDNWKKCQSNHFLFCWRRPRLLFRRHQERTWSQLFWFFSSFLSFWWTSWVEKSQSA